MWDPKIIGEQPFHLHGMIPPRSTRSSSVYKVDSCNTPPAFFRLPTLQYKSCHYNSRRPPNVPGQLFYFQIDRQQIRRGASYVVPPLLTTKSEDGVRTRTTHPTINGFVACRKRTLSDRYKHHIERKIKREKQYLQKSAAPKPRLQPTQQEQPFAVTVVAAERIERMRALTMRILKRFVFN